MESLLSLSNVCCSFGQRRVVDSVSFELSKGEHLTIVGPNGAGKTTLIRAIARLIPLESGEVLLQKRPLASLTRRDLACVASYVPQSLEVMFPTTVFEFVMMGRFSFQSPFRRTSKADREAVNVVLERVGLKDFANSLLGEVSGGERQRALIAAAIAQEALILLLDEPTTFLDPHQEESIYTLLKELRKEGNVTIISISHHLNSAAVNADKFLALKAGKQLFFGAPKEFMQAKSLESLYDQKFCLVRHPSRDIQMAIPR